MRKAYVGVLVMVCSLSWPLAQASAQTLDQRVAALGVSAQEAGTTTSRAAATGADPTSRP